MMGAPKKVVGVDKIGSGSGRPSHKGPEVLTNATNGKPTSEDHVMLDNSSERSDHETAPDESEVGKKGQGKVTSLKNGVKRRDAEASGDEVMENGVDGEKNGVVTNGVDKNTLTNGIHNKSATTNGVGKKDASNDNALKQETPVANGNGVVGDQITVVDLVDGDDQPMKDVSSGSHEDKVNGNGPSKDQGNHLTSVNGTQSPAVSVNGHSNGVPAPTQALVSAQPSSQAPAPVSIRHTREVSRLTSALQEVSEEAAQQVFKKFWRNVLFKPSNDDYLSFMLRAGLKNATLEAYDKTFKDPGIFKDGLIQRASRNQATREAVLKSVMPEELSILPSKVLDEAVAQRMKTASANDLVKWLANANRLGYHPDDLIDEDTEMVTPADQHPSSFNSAQGPPNFVPPHFNQQQASYIQVQEQQKQEQERQRHAHLAEQHRLAHQQMLNQTTGDPLLDEQNRQLELSRQAGTFPPPKPKKVSGVPGRKPNPPSRDPSDPQFGGPWTCDNCNQSFQNAAGHKHHVDKRVCFLSEKDLSKSDKPFTDQCIYCRKLFTGKQGLLYHSKKNVCKAYPTAAVSSSPANIAPAPPAPAPVYTPAPAHHPATTGDNSPSNQLHLEAAARSPRLSPPVISREPSDISTLPLRSSSIPLVPNHHQLPSQSTIPPPQGSMATFNGTPLRAEREYRPRQSTLPTPAVQTPPATHATRLRDSSDIRPGRNHSPSELPQEQLDEMNRRLRECDVNHEIALRNINPDLSEEDHRKKIASLKQGNASKKSMIRREYGVTIRAKRDKEDPGDMGGSVPPAAKAKIESFRASAKRKSASHLIEQPATVSGFSPINRPAPTSAPPPGTHTPHSTTERFREQMQSSPEQSPAVQGSTPNPGFASNSGFTPIQHSYSHSPAPRNIPHAHAYPATVISMDGRPPVAPPGFMAVPHYPGQNPISLDMNMRPHSPAIPPAMQRKRRRREENGVSMVEMSAEDATQSMNKRKKVPLNSNTQANWEALNGKSGGSERDTPMTDASPSAEAPPAVINLDTSTEPTPEVESAAVTAAAPADEVLPSVETAPEDPATDGDDTIEIEDEEVVTKDAPKKSAASEK